jgi:potassium-transporting ATPase KdpC subunit
MRFIVDAIRPVVVLFIFLSILTGIAYPLAVTGIAQLFFSDKANGSMLIRHDKVIGSALIGQSFTSAENFWSRPSATSPMPYNANASSGSNLGPTNPALIDQVNARINALKALDPSNTKPIPVDLVTASASGLDPDISLAAANYQVERVARARGVPVEKIRSLIAANTEKPLLGFIGEARVNVLKLNLALASLAK